MPFICDVADKYFLNLIEPRINEGLLYLNKSFAKLPKAKCFLQVVHLDQSLKDLTVTLFKTKMKNKTIYSFNSCDVSKMKKVNARF